MNEKSFDFCSIVGDYVTQYNNNPREFLAKAYEKYIKITEKLNKENIGG